MKPYRILKSFPGNQTGNGPTEHFNEGTVANLSDHLAEVVLKEGWVEPAKEAAKAKETKVAGPEENKVDEPEETKSDEPAKKFGGKKKAA